MSIHAASRAARRGNPATLLLAQMSGSRAYDADYVSQVETLKLRVVWNVQENSFGFNVLSGHVCQSPAWRTLSLPLYSPGWHAKVQSHYGRHFFSFRRPVQAGHRDVYR
jgi:hypothetical protein